MQHHEEILHLHNAKIVERYNKYTHNLPPLQAGDIDGTQWEKSSLSDQIVNNKSGLMDQEGLHLGTAVSSESVNSNPHQPKYQVQYQDQ